MQRAIWPLTCFKKHTGLPSLTALKHSVAVLNSIRRRKGNQWSEYSTSELVTWRPALQTIRAAFDWTLTLTLHIVLGGSWGEVKWEHKELVHHALACIWESRQ